MSQSDTIERDVVRETTELVAQLRKFVDADPAGFPDKSLQDLETLIVQVHGAKYDAGTQLNRSDATHSTSATAVLVTTTELMKAANLEIFELGMWQSWSGTK